MKRPIRNIILATVALAAFLLAAAFVVPVLSSRTANIYDKVQILNQIIAIVNENYVERVDWDKVMDGAFRGLLERLDPHSAYIPKKQFESINERFHGKFEGIGIEFDILGGYITVIAPIVGSPSDRAGLQPGDQIIAIEGKSAYKISKEEVFQKLRGPKGTKVNITVRRPGLDDPFAVQIIRDEIPIHSVTASFMLDDQTGYIRLSRFSYTTSQEVGEALEGLMSQGMSQLVFDLRTNSGGFLGQAVEIADYFVTTGDTLVYTVGRRQDSREVYLANEDVGYDQFALIVLINKWSASASEIVAGAVQDLDRGLIVGETSFGKGLVQRQWPLKDGSALRVTIARYYTPRGRLIQRPYENGTREYYQQLVDENRESVLDSLKETRPRYTTKAGREVFGGGGITPDVYIPPYDLTEATRKVVGHPQRFTFDWGTEYATRWRGNWASLRQFSEDFVVSDELLAQFKSFVRDRGVNFDERGLDQDADYLKSLLKAEVAGSIWGKEAYYRMLVAGDIQVMTALTYFDQAKEFLAPE